MEGRDWARAASCQSGESWALWAAPGRGCYSGGSSPQVARPRGAGRGARAPRDRGMRKLPRATPPGACPHCCPVALLPGRPARAFWYSASLCSGSLHSLVPMLILGAPLACSWHTRCCCLSWPGAGGAPGASRALSPLTGGPRGAPGAGPWAWSIVRSGQVSRRAGQPQPWERGWCQGCPPALLSGAGLPQQEGPKSGVPKGVDGPPPASLPSPVPTLPKPH